MTRNIFVLLFALAVVVSACSPIDFFENPGQQSEIFYSFEAFDELRVENILEVTLVPDTVNKVVYRGGRNIIEHASARLSNGVLTLDHDYKNWTRNFDHIKAFVHFTQLQQITPAAPCKITSQGVVKGDRIVVIVPVEADLVEMELETECREFKLHAYGSASGKFEITGECEKAIFVLNSITNLFAGELKCQEASVAQNGIGECHVWVEKTLSITIYNSGTIYYRGDPAIEIKRIQINNQTPTAKVVPEP